MDSKVDIILNPNVVVAHNELEGMFRDGVEELRRSIDKIALSLYSIQVHGTWRTAKNHEGENFSTWGAYTEWLGDDTKLSRSSMFDYKSMVRFAITNGLVENSNQFIDRGGVLTFRNIKRETVCNYDGEIIGLKGAKSDNPTEVIKEIVEIIDPDARPMDQVKLIKEVINGATDAVEVFFRLRKSDEGGYNLIWIKESNVGHEEGFVQYGCPDDVFDELKSKFHILG
jgi:hypothetical protein